MYVAKHSFRNFGKRYTAGSVITEPADIKRFKGKLAEGKIIEVTEQNLNAYADYFMRKYGVDIQENPKTAEPFEPIEPVAKPVKAPDAVKASTTVKPVVIVANTSKE